MNEEITVLDLFSGIGGFSLGLERAGPFRTVAFCEQDAYAQRVLRKHWPDTPIYDDVRTIPTDGLGRIDLICGGFPCQPWSVAGQQRGAEDDRDLWPAMASLIEKLQPRWVIGENVRGFVNEPMGLQRSLSDLARIGYQAVPFIIPACAVDAPHRRDRVWIVASGSGEDVADTAQLQRNGNGEYSEQSGRRVPQLGKRSGEEPVADASRQGLSIPQRETSPRTPARQDNVGRTATECRRWLSEPDVGGTVSDGFSRWMDEPDIPRVATGIENRVARLKCLGNAVVPQVVEQIGRAILAGEQR